MFRLRGTVAGVERLFLLPPGEHLVGQPPHADIALPVAGVSRRHAALRIGPESLEVEDLRSKNGTRVNGNTSARDHLLAGDEVSFGPARLTVEEVDEGDACLAMEFDGPEPMDSPTFPDPGQPQSGGGETSLLPSWPRTRDEATATAVVETALENLEPPGGPGAALGAVMQLLGAAGAAVLQQGPGPRRGGEGGEVVVALADGGGRSTAGAEPLLSRAAAAARRHGGWHLLVEPSVREGTATLVGTLADAGTALSLVLLEAPAGVARRGPLIRVLLRLFRRLGVGGITRPTESSPATTTPRSRLVLPPGFAGGRSPAMAAILDEIADVAETSLPVLLLGETGAGKEVAARTLHLTSRRAGPLVAVNCAALPADLLEAELFGIARGVATGVEARPGRIAEADGGTLLLDEIGEMPLLLQAKLLRVLQEREVHPLGGPPRAVDIRVVAATHQDLHRQARRGRFREDLYYRLAGAELEVPPLRERREDLPDLIRHFAAAAAEEANRPLRGVTLRALECLAAYPWPGNVRQLAHEVRRAVVRAGADGLIDTSRLSPALRQSESDGALPALDSEGPKEPSLDLKGHTRRLEARILREALERARGNRSQASRLLGIARNTLAAKIALHGLDG